MHHVFFVRVSSVLLGVIASVVLLPSSASAMASQFDPRADVHTPFAVIAQQSFLSPVAHSVHIIAPQGGEILTPLTATTIAWDSQSSLGFVNIDYTVDNGITWEVIEHGVVDLGTYRWRVPDIYAKDAMVRVTQTDLVEVFASDCSDTGFVMNGAKPMGVSPVTGLPEEITPVAPGNIITAPSFTTVYAIDGDGTRRPFDLPGVIDTYTLKNNPRVTVTDATLATIPLGVPMLPKPGTVLVRFPSARTVYAVEGNASYAILRPLSSEKIAAEIYGPEWKTFVWTLPDGYKNFYHGGSAIVTVIETDKTELRPVATM